MGRRIVALSFSDDGTTRAAVIETKLRGFHLLSVSRAVAPQSPQEPEPEAPGGGSRDAPPVPLDALLDQPLADTDLVALEFPGHRAFIKRLTLPFKDDRQIAQTLPFQMLGLVPLKSENVHCSFKRLGSAGAETEVLAVATEYEALEHFLNSVRSRGVNPEFVAVGGVVLAALLPYLEKESPGKAIVWLDGSTLDMVVAHGERVVLARSVLLGEDAIRENELSGEVVREVFLTIARAADDGYGVQRLWMAGPQADRVLPLLREALEQDVSVLDPGQLNIPLDLGCPDLEPADAKVVALALAAAMERSSPGGVDLLVGAFATQKAQGLLRERLGTLAVTALIALALMGGKAAVRYLGLRAEREQIAAEAQALSRAIFGESVSGLTAFERKIKSLDRDAVSVFPSKTAIDHLEAIVGAAMAVQATRQKAASEDQSSADVSEYPLELETVRIDLAQAWLRGEADSIETLEGFVAELQRVACFQDVSTESTERIMFRRHRGWQRFSIKIGIECEKRRERDRVKKKVKG